VPHVELSVSDPHVRRTPVGSSLDQWAAAVTDAAEPCLVIDAQAVIVALSESCRTLLGLDRSAVGQSLFDGVLRLLDFSSAASTLADGELNKIPPLLALSSGRLARGLLRVACADGGAACTLDAIATPLLDGEKPAGSLTFFSEV
jgi:hypothetical protein